MLWVELHYHCLVDNERGLDDQHGGGGPSLHPSASFDILFLETLIFYHLGQKNCIADDAYCLFRLSDTSFLAHVSVTYP